MKSCVALDVKASSDSLPEGNAELPDDGLPEDFHDWEDDDEEDE